MTTAADLLKLTLKKHGYSVTAARQKVFTALENQEPQAMYTLVKSLEPEINRASVYRVVALYEALGIVQRIQIGWKYKLELSNTFQDHHHHLVCKQCGHIDSFDEHKGLEKILADIAETSRFSITDHTLELQGLCAGCQ